MKKTNTGNIWIAVAVSICSLAIVCAVLRIKK